MPRYRRIEQCYWERKGQGQHFPLRSFVHNGISPREAAANSAENDQQEIVSWGLDSLGRLRKVGDEEHSEDGPDEASPHGYQPLLSGKKMSTPRSRLPAPPSPAPRSVDASLPRTHRPQRLLPFTPLARQITECNLEREINQDGQREILLLQSFFEQLERGGGVVGSCAELGE